MKKYSDKLGVLKYELLAKKGLIFAARDQDNKIVPLTKDDSEIHDLKTIEYGQHHAEKCNMIGLGRKVRVWANTGIEVWEG